MGEATGRRSRALRPRSGLRTPRPRLRRADRAMNASRADPVRGLCPAGTCGTRLGRHYYSNFHMTTTTYAATWSMCAARPCFPHVYPSAVDTLARFVERSGMEPLRNVRASSPSRRWSIGTVEQVRAGVRLPLLRLLRPFEKLSVLADARGRPTTSGRPTELPLLLDSDHDEAPHLLDQPTASRRAQPEQLDNTMTQ
jgi:hypothetical protein